MLCRDRALYGAPNRVLALIGAPIHEKVRGAEKVGGKLAACGRGLRERDVRGGNNAAMIEA